MLAIRQHFGAGTPLYRTTASSGDIEVLASATQTLLVNKRSTAVTVGINGKTVSMGAHKVVVISAGP